MKLKEFQKDFHEEYSNNSLEEFLNGTLYTSILVIISVGNLEGVSDRSLTGFLEYMNTWINLKKNSCKNYRWNFRSDT